MSASQYHFTNKRACEQGATFWKFLAEKLDDGTYRSFAGCTVKMQVRPSAGSATLIVELNTSNGKGFATQRALPNGGGTVWGIELKLTDEETAALAANVYVYDMEITNADGDVVRFIQGSFEVVAEVTR